MKQINAVVLLATLGLLVLTNVATGQGSVVDNPRGVAMGALSADAIGTSGIIHNPAGLSRAYVYQIDLVYLRNDPGKLNITGVNIADSKSQPVLAAGLSYGFHSTDKGSEFEQKGHDARLGFSHPAIPDKLHLGVGLRYLEIERSADDLQGFTVDAGLIFSATKGFHIGLVGKNLVDLDDPMAPRQAGGGFAFTGDAVTLTTDVLIDFNRHIDGPKPIFATGLEGLMGDAIPIRIGYTNDRVTAHQFIGGGLGFIVREGGGNGQLMLAYRHNLTETSNYTFGIGLTMFL
ncbi:MAG: hypothetical protein VYA30_00440 [Myxococcota bacterium]|nr:hypothetical protein [Myxococcota bacterium]